MTLNLPLAGSPCGKRRYYDPIAAGGVRDALEAWDRAHGQARPDRELVVYYCDRCGAFHVGHKRKGGGH
jgi:hypothetical protein